ncbi:hypothetical protein D3C71_1804970 [compost metagenome]
MYQFFGHLWQHPDIDLVDQCAIAKVIIKGVNFHLAAVIAHHAIGAGTDRMARELRQALPLARQYHGVHAAQQPRQPVIGAVQMHVNHVGRRRRHAFDMGEQRLWHQPAERTDDIFHFQLAPMVEMNGRA